MSRRRIRTLGDPVLRKKAASVKKVTEELRRLIADMFETMEAASGIGLAAPQIGISKRVIVVDVPVGEHEHERMALVNPEIVSFFGEIETMEEGCLSIPGVRADVKRNCGAMVAGINEEGEKVRFPAEGLTARCIQHEIDHLNGTLFIDHSRIAESDAKARMQAYLAEKAAAREGA